MKKKKEYPTVEIKGFRGGHVVLSHDPWRKDDLERLEEAWARITEKQIDTPKVG